MITGIAAGDTVLFIGDSITDCGRDRRDPEALGHGFAARAAASFTAAHPGASVRFANRGISGNRVADLRGRWDVDCLSLEPDVVSIMIGVNEVWRRFDSADPTPDAVFERHFRYVLERTLDHGARLIIMEPFLLPVDEEQRGWLEELDGKLAVVRTLAKDYGANLIATHALMTGAAAAAGGAAAIADDGVHPTPAGHEILAEAWLAAVEPTSV